MTNPITSVNQVTPEWLTQVLREGGYLNRGRVTAIHSGFQGSATSEGPGFLPAHRFQVSYSGDASLSAPERLYLKLNTGEIHQRASLQEFTFYTAIAAEMPVPPSVPCHHAVYDPESGASHFLLGDVSGTHRTVHPEEPSTKGDTTFMLEALARLHAYWWNHPRLGKGVGTPPTEVSIEDDFRELQEAFPGYVDFLGDRLSKERRGVYELVLSRFPEALAERLLEEKRLTVVHNDAHAGNFFLPRQSEKHACYIGDWEQWGVHNGIRDVAYMIALFWYPERRARLEIPLVSEYHSRLQDYGVTGYDWNACWEDYRFHAIENLFVPYWAWIDQGAHWGFHRWHQLEKAMHAFEDLGCEEFLA